MLLVGSGAREHALAWRLSRSPSLTALHAAPGNPGIAALGDCHPVRADDGEGLLDLARTLAADLVVIGPEAPLVAGVGDRLRHAGIPVFGPSAAAARIEGSKAFAKEVLDAAGVPAAATLAVARPPCVVKADGLAAGKGVFVCRTDEEVEAGLARRGRVRRHGRRRGAARGPGGVALRALRRRAARCRSARRRTSSARSTATRARTPAAWARTRRCRGSPTRRELVDRIHQPVLDELARRGTPFVGCLFAGLMLTADGPRVLEFNARFGDPETQVLVPRLEGDLLAALAAAAAGDAVRRSRCARATEAAVTVVLAGPDYPARSDYVGAPIEGIADAEAAGALVFHGGTALARRHARHERRPHPLGHRARRRPLPRRGRGRTRRPRRCASTGARFRGDIAAAVG